MTADSTSRFSHFQGARSVPATMAVAGSVSAGAGASGDSSIESSGGGSEETPNTSSPDATQPWAGLTAPALCASDGTWASDRYSAKRFAEKFSTAQLSMDR